MSSNSNELREALKKDWRKLYVKEFTTNWQAERIVRETEIDIMSFEALEKLLADREIASRIDGMKQARSRVLRRTEIPKDAKNPTRDIVVEIGEVCAEIIQNDIDALSPTKSDGGENG